MPAGMVTAVEAAWVPPAASAGTARPPRSTSAASQTGLVESQKVVVEPPAAPPPWLRVVSLTVSATPAPAVGGAVKADSTRSGPTWNTAVVMLLVSLVSATAPAASVRTGR